MNYHNSCVFTVVFTVVFTACSLRVHCVFTVRTLRLGAWAAKGAKKHVVSFGVATAAGLLTCARWSARSLSYVGAHECIHFCVNAGTCTRAHICRHVCTRIFTRVRRRVCRYVCKHACVHECMHVRVCACTHTCTHVGMHASFHSGKTSFLLTVDGQNPATFLLIFDFAPRAPNLILAGRGAMRRSADWPKSCTPRAQPTNVESGAGGAWKFAPTPRVRGWCRILSINRLRSCVIHAWALRGRPTYARIAVISALPVSSSLQGTWHATSSLWCVCACVWWRWWWWLQRCLRCKEWLQGAGSSVASTDRKPLLKCAACPELRPELARAPCGGV